MEQCLQHHMKDETLSDENSWKCPKCKQRRVSSKTIFLSKIPEVLVIHLKRFDIFGNKRENMVAYPLYDLDLQPFTHLQDNENPMYELYAVNNHIGTQDFGHYYSYCRFGQQWYCFNDEQVFKIRSDVVVNNNAYLLFYRKRKACDASLELD